MASNRVSNGLSARKRVRSASSSGFLPFLGDSEEDHVSLLSQEEGEEFRPVSEGSEDEELPAKKRFKSLEETLSFLRSATIKPLKNDKRRAFLSKFLTDAAHPPKLDDSVSCLVLKSAKSYDKFLSKLQQFTMDVMTPLTWALNEVSSGRECPANQPLSAGECLSPLQC